jgi:hypothetical protein
VILTGVALEAHPGIVEGFLAMIFGGPPATVTYDILVDAVQRGPKTLERKEQLSVSFDNLTSCRHSLEIGTRYRLGADATLAGLTVPFGAVEVLPTVPFTAEPVSGGSPGFAIAAVAILAVVAVAIGGWHATRSRR